MRIAAAVVAVTVAMALGGCQSVTEVSGFPPSDCPYHDEGECVGSADIDLDCADLPGTVELTVAGYDPSDLDRDGDGFGCD